MINALLTELQALETELHRGETRADVARLDALLHDDFLEIGRSGRIHDKATTFASPPAGGGGVTLIADRFDATLLAEDVALLTYRSAQVHDDGRQDAFTLRASLWMRSSRGWQVRLHQGTPTAPFDPSLPDGSASTPGGASV